MHTPCTVESRLETYLLRHLNSATTSLNSCKSNFKSFDFEYEILGINYQNKCKKLINTNEGVYL